MPVLDLQPGSEGRPSLLAVERPGLARRRELRRRLGRLRVSKRWLDQCWGARAGAWLARANTLGFIAVALYTARPFPEARAAVVRLSLVVLSWCAGLGALSLAGPALERWLEAGRGLLENRGVGSLELRRERPLLLVYWTLRQLGVLVALVLVACLVTAPSVWNAAQLVGLGAGAFIYLTALGAGLGVLAHLCSELGGTRGQSLLLGIVLVPELVSPAWPELPTIISGYRHLLDACLGMGFSS